MHHTQSPDTIHSDIVCSARPLAGSSTVAPVLDADLSLLDSFDCSTITSNSLGDLRFQSCDFTSDYLSNQQYSVTAVTTSPASVAERYAYTAYSQPTFLDAAGTPLTTQTSTLNARYSYMDREWDAAPGLYHFRAPWMSGVAGRFSQRDPIGYNGSKWGLNGFSDQSPSDSTDPLGLMRVMHSPLVQAPIVRGALYNAFERQCAACNHSDFAVTQPGLCNYADCIAAAAKISSAPFHTIVGNGKRQRSYLDEEKKFGRYCYAWATGFRGVFHSVDSHHCFTTKVQESRQRYFLHGNLIHQWLRIKCDCGGDPMHLDNGFGKGEEWVYSEQPTAGYPLAPVKGDDVLECPSSYEAQTKCTPVQPHDENGKKVSDPFF